MSKAYEDENVACVMYVSDCNKFVKIEARIKSPERFSKMEMIASNPVIPMTAYHGTGLPYSCIDQALEGTKNKIDASKDGIINTTFSYPNSYYTSDLKTKVRPSIFFHLKAINDSIKSVVVRVELPDPYPLRTLIYRPGYYKGPQFYNAKEDVVPIASAYDTMMNIKAAKVRYDIAM